MLRNALAFREAVAAAPPGAERAGKLAKGSAERGETGPQRQAYPDRPYSQLLWWHYRDGQAYCPRDMPGLQRKLVAAFAEDGCRCALNRRMECEESRPDACWLGSWTPEAEIGKAGVPARDVSC